MYDNCSYKTIGITSVINKAQLLLNYSFNHYRERIINETGNTTFNSSANS
jgi:hypothetical protein